MSEWISVKERLPKGADGLCVCELVSAYTVDGEVTVGWRNQYAWYLILGDEDSISEYEKDYVTHWMPLPEPPKEG